MPNKKTVKQPMTRVINFSGGKSSAYMTLMLKPTENDVVLFCDTKREHPKTYEFIDAFEKNEGIKVHRAVYEKNGLLGFDALSSHLTMLPNVAMRRCTLELKIRTAKRYLRDLGIQHFENYIGFRFDEERRVKNHVARTKKIVYKFPMYEEEITKVDVNSFWESKAYTLDIPPILGNCVGCFLKGPLALTNIFEHYPQFAEPWIKDEEKIRTKNNDTGTYIKGVKYSDMLKKSKTQHMLFDLDSTEIEETGECSVCTF